MIFLGNAASFHLRTWEKIYALCGEPVGKLCSIHPRSGGSGTTHLSKPLAYAALGLRLRRLPGGTLLHAHGASGYGLSALLSGHRYIATIYGSELLRPHSQAYRRMLGAVLRRASAITVTSKAARERLSAIQPALSGKTFLFHTGIDTHEAAAAEAKTPRSPNDNLEIMLLRNAAPHYRTHEVLQAILQAISGRTNVRITVPFGNGDNHYFSQLKALFPDPRCQFIDQPVSHGDFLSLVARSDICVNFPVSDQVSSTLIEALYFDCVVVSNRLDAYADLLDEVGRTENWIAADPEEMLAGAMAQAIQRAQTRGTIVRTGRDIAIERFSTDSAARAFRPVLESLR